MGSVCRLHPCGLLAFTDSEFGERKFVQDFLVGVAVAGTGNTIVASRAFIRVQTTCRMALKGSDVPD